MTPDRLIAFLIVFSDNPAGKKYLTAWFSIQKGMASIDRIDQILEAEEKWQKRGACWDKRIEDSIEFRMYGLLMRMNLSLKV